MIIVTGAFGMVGSNLVKKLNQMGHSDLILVDNLSNGKKIFNLSNARFVDYFDKDEFLDTFGKKGLFDKINLVFHQGACSTTTEWDGKYLMKNNFSFSRDLYEICMNRNIRFIYASSASVYGLGKNGFKVDKKCENPINAYAFSKLSFDNYVRAETKNKNNVVGLRYFNIFGPCEEHKGSMASTMFHFNNQVKNSGYIELFGAYDSYAEGEQRRDFIYVDDIIKLVLWSAFDYRKGGIFNAGTGKSRTFNEVAKLVLLYHGKAVGNETLKYIDFPNHLKKSYQSDTCADINLLRSEGYSENFISLEDGINKYLKYLNDD